MRLFDHGTFYHPSPTRLCLQNKVYYLFFVHLGRARACSSHVCRCRFFQQRGLSSKVEQSQPAHVKHFWRWQSMIAPIHPVILSHSQFTNTQTHTFTTIYLHVCAMQSIHSKLFCQHEMWDFVLHARSSSWYNLPPFYPGGQEAKMRRVRRGKDARERSQKNVTLKATPCLNCTASQQGLSDPVTGHCRGQHTASCAHCHSCQSARFDSWQMMLLMYPTMWTTHW